MAFQLCDKEVSALQVARNVAARPALRLTQCFMRRVLGLLVLLTLAAGCGEWADLSWLPWARPPLPLDTLADRRHAFTRAYDAYRHHDYTSALPIFKALVPVYPELIDYHLYFGGVAAARLQREGDVERLLSRLVNEYPDSVFVPAAELELGQSAKRRGKLDSARAHLYRCINISGDKETGRAAHLAIAQIEQDAGDVDAAYRDFAELREAAPGSAIGKTAKESILALRAAHPELAPSGRDRLAELRLLLAEHDYDAAEASANQLRDNPGDTDPALIVRLLGEAEYGAGKLEPALKTLWTVADRYPDSPEAPQALARLGTILWNRDRDVAARRIFVEFMHRYARHEKADEVQYAIARIDQKAGRPQDAIDEYATLVDDYPTSKLATEARWRIGWIHYRNDRWSAAAAAFARIHDGGTSSMYWRARALEHGNATEARRLYRSILTTEPDGYYALWAQRRLDGKAGPLRLTATAPSELPPSTLDPGPFAESFHRPRAEELRAAGRLTLARRELAAIQSAHGDDQAALRFLIATYPSVDGQAAAAHLAQRLEGNVLSPLELDRLKYPLAYWSTVRQHADAALVDALLVVAIMRQESLFDPEARSTADARGLMQLLPSTAKRLSAAEGSSGDDIDLYDPDINIDLGVRYLRSLDDRFGSDPLKVIAAYNGGESAVAKWQHENADLDGDELVESIGYRETRDYVKRVLANYRKYERLYGSGQ
ncbi:MAG TPA: transglycosylase SLT domain-containing protein [Candidatus Acidoferrales bacterium]|nr:transglycosylase SLT domain-containing protein [Candidatus Acidoferrales bacterium]